MATQKLAGPKDPIHLRKLLADKETSRRNHQADSVCAGHGAHDRLDRRIGDRSQEVLDLLTLELGTCQRKGSSGSASRVD